MYVAEKTLENMQRKGPSLSEISQNLKSVLISELFR